MFLAAVGLRSASLTVLFSAALFSLFPAPLVAACWVPVMAFVASSAAALRSSPGTTPKVGAQYVFEDYHSSPFHYEVTSLIKLSPTCDPLLQEEL